MYIVDPCLGGILILRRQPRGRGVSQMSVLLNIALFSKIIYKGGGGVKKVQNLVYVENGCPLSLFSKISDYRERSKISTNGFMDGP